MITTVGVVNKMVPVLKEMSYVIPVEDNGGLKDMERMYLRITQSQETEALVVTMSVDKNRTLPVYTAEALTVIGHMQDALDHYKKLLNNT